MPCRRLQWRCLAPAFSWWADAAVVDVHLDVLNPTSQVVGVRLRLRPRLRQLRLQLPGWTPGSYLIRDYVRHLEALDLRQGEADIPLRRLGPACWQANVDPQGPDLEIRYRVLAPELTVRTCHLDQDHGFLALAAVVLEVEGERWSPHRLHCLLPPLGGPSAHCPVMPPAPMVSSPATWIICSTARSNSAPTTPTASAWRGCPTAG